MSSRSVHVLFSYRGNRQRDSRTNKQTYAGDSIILAKAFAGIKIQVTVTHPFRLVGLSTPTARLIFHHFFDIGFFCTFFCNSANLSKLSKPKSAVKPKCFHAAGRVERASSSATPISPNF